MHERGRVVAVERKEKEWERKEREEVSPPPPPCVRMHTWGERRKIDGGGVREIASIMCERMVQRMWRECERRKRERTLLFLFSFLFNIFLIFYFIFVIKKSFSTDFNF